MQLTRQDLEDIWENKPYGYFSKMLSTRKGKKKYRVMTEVRKTSVVVIDTDEQEVWAKDATAAQGLVHQQAVLRLRNKHGLAELGTDPYVVEVLQAMMGLIKHDRIS
jgi:hypothetical protein